MNAVKIVRRYLGVSRKTLSECIGISLSYLSEIESENKTPSYPMLKKIASGLGVPAWKIIFVQENSYNESTAIQAFSNIKDAHYPTELNHD